MSSEAVALCAVATVGVTPRIATAIAAVNNLNNVLFLIDFIVLLLLFDFLNIILAPSMQLPLEALSAACCC
jgi:hypothetical protein